MTPVASSEKPPCCNATLECRHQHVSPGWKKVAHQLLQASQWPKKMSHGAKCKSTDVPRQLHEVAMKIP